MPLPIAPKPINPTLGVALVGESDDE
jgi:hypothetical protein